MYFDRQFGNGPIPDKYIAHEICWQLNGALPFANGSFHDDQVLNSSWDGQNLIMELDPDCWFNAKGESASALSITFVNAQVLRQEKWFDGPTVRWLYHDLKQSISAYEVEIAGELVWLGCERILQSERKTELIIRATDIQVRIDDEVLTPELGELPVGELIRALSWNAPKERQHAAKQHIVRQQNFPYITLILPLGYKDCWENCAGILCGLSDDELQPLLPSMLQWLMDMNWPGAESVLKRLTQVQAQIMKPALEATVHRACNDKDDIWLHWLSGLLKNSRISTVLDVETRTILQAHLLNDY